MKRQTFQVSNISSFLFSKLTPFSSRAASGLLMLLTNLLTCSKCLVISVARTISMIACRSVRYSFLGEEERGRDDEGRDSRQRENREMLRCGKQHGKLCELFLYSSCSDSGNEWMLCLLPHPHNPPPTHLSWAAHMSFPTLGPEPHYSALVS